MEKTEILYEDDQIIVCQKPAGLAVQTARVGQMDLESELRSHLQGGFVGIVQRLDQPVEGILVFGKTRQATAELNRQQQNGQIKKIYLAAFEGRSAKREGTFTDFLLKDGRTNTSQVVKAGTPQAKKAVLDYRLLEQKENVGLMEIRLHTGRHHQIRVQMAAHDMPLIGDVKYHAAPGKTQDGIGLCARELEFLHPKTKKVMRYQIQPKGEIFAQFYKRV